MPNRKCLFCDSPKLSFEHIYPQWVFKYIEGFENVRFTPKHDAFGLSTNAEDSIIFLDKHEKGKDIPYTKFGVKCVCQICNNTWMSANENNIISTISKLFYNEIEFSQLSQEQRYQLSLWVLTKILVINQCEIAPVIFADEIYEAIRKGQIPKGFFVEICKGQQLYLNYVLNTIPEPVPVNISFQELFSGLDGFYMAGFQIGDLMFRVSFLNEDGIYRIKLNRETFLLFPYDATFPLVKAEYSKWNYLLENPNAELEYLCRLMILSDSDSI